MMTNIIQKVGESEMCVCPRCGYAQQRTTGIPCIALICPKCKVPMK